MSKEKKDNSRRAIKPDAQGFDEVKIITKPRFKTSGLSGDEWRISGFCQLLRKGKVIHEFSMANVENCAKALPAEIMKAHDEGKFLFAGEGNTCDQEGCSEEVSVYFKLKKHYCNEPHIHAPIEYPENEIVVRAFCSRHSKRGDSSFEDNDDNYILLDGKPEEIRTEDKKEAKFGGIIPL